MRFLLGAFLTFQIIVACSQNNNKVKIISKHSGYEIKVDDQSFFINGMNWDYFPIGTNYSFSLWNKDEVFISIALDYEMQMLQDLGINTIRVYDGIPPKWITYIYNKFGIYTIINHPLGRYGYKKDGEWHSKTQYSDIQVFNLLKEEAEKLAEKYQNTPGLLMYLLGNENNYGLHWKGNETENFPQENSTSFEEITSLYKLFNESAQIIKEIDPNHPVSICNGDLQNIDIIAKECQNIDCFGANVYRGSSFDKTFEEVRNKLNKPLIFTEFGADAFDSNKQIEDQEAQAYYLINNWKEIYENSINLAESGNCIGGFTFQFSDGWWKTGQTKNLAIHDSTASWKNGGYTYDFVKGTNNMNEEWFGICKKEFSDELGHYKLIPRKAYYALKKMHHFDVLAKTSDKNKLYNLVSEIEKEYTIK